MRPDGKVAGPLAAVPLRLIRNAGSNVKNDAMGSIHIAGGSDRIDRFAGLCDAVSFD